MPVIDEPVRGSALPPWFVSLPGIERIRALAEGFVPRPPLFRLLGIRVGHVAPGSVTLTMPASAWTMNSYGTLMVEPFVETALATAVTTAVEAGADVEPITLGMHYLRPIQAQSGSLLARARLVHLARSFAYSEVEIEDAEGRRVIHAAMQSIVRSVEPEPPLAPPLRERIVEPSYPVPDPVYRPAPEWVVPSSAEWDRDPLALCRTLLNAGSSGERELYGVRYLKVDERQTVVALPASAWLGSGFVSPGAFATLASAAGSVAALTVLPAQHYYAGLQAQLRIHRRVPADGRALRAEAELVSPSPEDASTNITIRDAGGSVVAVGFGSALYMKRSLRAKAERSESRRTLATLVFVDIVDSTGHAERRGDADWRELLEKYRAVVRAEIGRRGGIEVDTAGDGFFVRFESPGSAIACARAARDGVRRLGIELRSGVHTGECELDDGKPVGMAVHVAARIQTTATPGEILVSETVKALATGSGLAFADRGVHELKGVPDPWRLHALEG